MSSQPPSRAANHSSPRRDSASEAAPAPAPEPECKSTVGGAPRRRVCYRFRHGDLPTAPRSTGPCVRSGCGVRRPSTRSGGRRRSQSTRRRSVYKCVVVCWAVDWCCELGRCRFIESFGVGLGLTDVCPTEQSLYLVALRGGGVACLTVATAFRTVRHHVARDPKRHVRGSISCSIATPARKGGR